MSAVENGYGGARMERAKEERRNTPRDMLAASRRPISNNIFPILFSLLTGLAIVLLFTAPHCHCHSLSWPSLVFFDTLGHASKRVPILGPVSFFLSPNSSQA